MSKKEPLKTTITAEWHGEATLDPIAMRAIHTLLKSNSSAIKGIHDLIRANHNQLISIQSILDMNSLVMAALIPSSPTNDDDNYISEADSVDDDGV